MLVRTLGATGPSWTLVARVAAGVLVCVVVPLASWATDGRGRLAFTMYASTVTYRLEVTATDAAGRRRRVDPADLAGEVSSPAAPYLRGASGFRTVAQIDPLRAHLRDVARAGCRAFTGDVVEVVLRESPTPLRPGDHGGCTSTSRGTR